MLFGSANHDPRVFATPDVLDVGRPNAPEQFASGAASTSASARRSPGSSWKRALRALAERAPRRQLAAEPLRVPAFVIRGFQAVEVELVATGST
jgi:cytochrome P450